MFQSPVKMWFYFVPFYKPLIPCFSLLFPCYCWMQLMAVFLFNSIIFGQTPFKCFCVFSLQTWHLHSHSYQQLLSTSFAMGGPYRCYHTLDFSMSHLFKWSLTLLQAKLHSTDSGFRPSDHKSKPYQLILRKDSEYLSLFLVLGP